MMHTLTELARTQEQDGELLETPVRCRILLVVWIHLTVKAI